MPNATTTRRLVRGLIAALLALGCGVGSPTHVAPSRAAPPDDISQLWPDRAIPADQPVGVVIELAEPPVAAVYAAAQAEGRVASAALTQAAQAQLGVVEAAQQQLVASLDSLDAQVLYRVQRVYNGVAVHLPAGQLPALSQLPGVKAVHPLVAKVPSNATSVPYIGAPVLWEGGDYPAATGRGIRIGIIDTGVDYLHVDFDGPGVGYDANDPTQIGDVPGFPSAKVRGGYDFAGDDYNAEDLSSGGAVTPVPDADPMDCYGHGTHVAGTAAGVGVTKTGQSYPGPYSSTLNFADFRIGPGVAPEAEIYALKVFGCAGSSEIVDEAIEWAVDPNGDGDFSDRMHVINLSLGSTAGAVDDPTAVAAENAALVGVIVVASAGNDGDVFFSVGSPSVATHAISVAASGFTSQGDLMAGFSARGPRRDDLAIKPEISAPGVGIISAAAGTGASAFSLSGTSMATPHVSGAFALLRQIYPDPELGGAQGAASGAAWTNEELKALVINTAQPVIHAGGIVTAPVYGATRVGGGLLDLHDILETQIVAYSASNPGAVALSFGAPEVLDVWTATANVRLANKSAAPITVTVAYSAVNDMPGVEVSVPASTVVAVPAHGYATLPVTLHSDTTTMARVPDPTLSYSTDNPRQWLSEESGLLSFMLDDGPARITLPVYAAPRAVAQMAAGGVLDFGAAPQARATLTLTGQALTGTATPTESVALVSAFELHYASQNNLPPIGTTRTLYDHADLAYVGATVAQSPGTVYFGLATHAAWSTPNEVEFDIYLDTDLNGSADYRVFNSSREGYLSKDGVGDTLVSVVENRRGERSIAGHLNGYAATALDTALYDTNVMVLPVTAAALGLTGAMPAFAYRVATYSLDISNARALGMFVDQTPWLYFNPAQPGLKPTGDTGEPPLYVDRPGATLGVTFDLAGYLADHARGLLIFHHHNVSGPGERGRAQVVPVTYQWPYTSQLPIVRR